MLKLSRIDKLYYLKCIGVILRLVSMAAIVFCILYLGYMDFEGIITSILVGVISESLLKLCCYYYRRI